VWSLIDKIFTASRISPNFAVKDNMADRSDEDIHDAKAMHVKSARKSRVPLFAGIAVAVLVVLALALGLGLGLGLKKHERSSSESSGNGNGNGQTGANIPAWRKATEEYSLDMGWNINAAPTTRSYDFTVSEMTIAPDGELQLQVCPLTNDSGVSRTVLGINNQFPGPLIRINRGDTLVVSLTNNLSNATTMHWHGMFQNGTNWMDGTTGVTQCPIPPGKTFTYNFTVENQYGTYWYHAHNGMQYSDGIVGPLVIHAPEEADARKMYDYDQVVMIQDWYHDMATDLLDSYLSSGAENNEPVPDNGLIQGTNYFNCSSYDSDSGYTCAGNSTRPTFGFASGKRYRLRFINSGSIATFQVSVDNHTLSVIEADGTAVAPLPVHRFEIAVAERISVILTLNQTSSNYWIHAQMNPNCFAGDNDVLDMDVKAILSYTNSTVDPTDKSVDWNDQLDLVCQDLNSTLLVPVASEQAPTADALYEIQFSFNIGDDALDRGVINGTSWTPNIPNPTINQAISGISGNPSNISTTTSSQVKGFSANQFIISLPAVQTIDLIIMNFDDGSHPFHLHGHIFWVMATSQEQYFPWETDLYSQINSTSRNDYTTNPMRRDTLTIPEYGWALIRFRNDNPGMWALHCHIAWHMEAGLLMQFMSLGDVMKGWTLPKDVAGLCTA
jgi:FtsP/CotA-like multicopper oxidase with cupredoxin domain